MRILAESLLLGKLEEHQDCGDVLAVALACRK